MPKPPNANFKLLTVPAESAHAARRQPAVRQATDEGWQIRDIWPSALDAPGHAERPPEADAEEAPEANERELGGAASPETILYMVRLERGRIRYGGGLSRLRSVLKQYGLTAAGALAIVAILGLLAFLLLDVSPSSPERSRPATEEAQPTAPSPSDSNSSAQMSRRTLLPDEAGAPAPRDTAGSERPIQEPADRLPTDESSFASARASDAPTAEPSPATDRPSAESAPSPSANQDAANRDAANRDAANRDAAPAAGSASSPDAAPRAASGILRLTSDPAGATVQLDGRRVGRTPVRVTDVPAGPHTVLLQANGHEPHRRRVTVRAARTATVETSLAPLTATLSVLVRPWGKIYVDGELYEREADVRYTTALPVGHHRIAVVHPELGRWEKTVRLEAGEEESLTVDFNQRPSGASPAASPSTF